MASLKPILCAGAIGLLLTAGAAHAQNPQNEQKDKTVETPKNTPVPLPTLPQAAPSPDNQTPPVKSDLPGYQPMRNDSQRQRDDSLAAEHRRTSGELNPYPNAPIGMPAPEAKSDSKTK
jgi:hypothetical protein